MIASANRYKNKYRKTKKNVVHSNRAFVMGAIGFVSIIWYVIELVLAASSSDDVMNIIPAIGVILMITSIVATVIGYGEFRVKTFSRLSRFIGFYTPLVATIMWAVLYIIGLLFG